MNTRIRSAGLSRQAHHRAGRLWLLVLGFWSLAAFGQEALRLGVPAYRELARVRTEFQPLVSALSDQLDRPVELRVLPPLVLVEAYAEGRIDLLLAGSQLQGQLHRRMPLPAPLATLRRTYRGESLTLLAGTLLARAEVEPLRDFRQLGERRLAIPESVAPEGSRDLSEQLAHRGLPPVPPGQVRWTRSHEEAVRLLQLGEVDIALVRSGVLESMVDLGEVQRDELQVLAARQSPGLPLAHTTVPQPEWAAFPGLSMDATERRRLALTLLALELPEPEGGAGIEHIAGFDPPATYAIAPIPLDPAPRRAVATRVGLAVLAGLLPGLLGWFWSRRRHRRQLDAARTETDRIRQLLDSLPVGVWHRGNQGSIDYLNARVRDVLSLKPNPLLDPLDYPTLFPEAVAAQLAAADEATRQHGSAHAQRLRLATPDGQLRELELIQVRTLDAERRIDGVLSVAIQRAEAGTVEIGPLISRYEELLARLSADLVSADSGSVDAAIHRALAALGEASAVDRAYLFLFNAAQTHADNTHEWCAPTVTPQLPRMQDLDLARDYPWLLSALRQGQAVNIEDVSGLPEIAAAERQMLAEQHIRSALIVPMRAGERVAGFIGFDDTRAPRVWQPAEQSLLRLAGEMLLHALLRLRAERSLVESVTYQRALIDALPDLLFVLDAQGNFLDIHARDADQLLMPREQALSRNIDELLPPEVARRTRTALDRIFAGSARERYDYELDRENGRRSFAAEMAPLDSAHALVLCRDITDRRRTESALLASEARYRALVDHSQSLIFQLGADERLAFLSCSTRRLLGLEPASLVHRPLRELVARDDHRILDGYLQQLSQGHSDRTDPDGLDTGIELRFLQSDGQRRWMHLVMTRIGTGAAGDLVGNAVDIQGRVEAREQLVGVAAQLQAVIDGVPSYIFAKDADGCYRMVNRSCAGAFGRSASEMIGLTDFEIIGDSEVAAQYRAHDRQAIGLDQPLVVEQELVPHSDGRQVWCQTTKMRWHFPGDPRPGVLGISTDIHHRIESEARLRRESELTALLVRLALTYIDLPAEQLDATMLASLRELTGFVGADRGYVFRYDQSQQTLSNVLEWCAEGISPQIHNLQAVPMSDYAEFTALHLAGRIAACASLDELSDETTRRNFAAQDIRSLLTVPLMRRERCHGFVGFDWVRSSHQRSTTETQLLQVFAQMLVNAQMQAEASQSLEHHRRRLELVIEGTAAGTWIWWPQSGALEINERWARILGYTADELAPVDFETWRRLSRQEDLAIAEAALAAHATGQSPIYEARLRMRHQDGHWVWVLTRGRIVERDAQGEVLVYAGTHQDVTAQVLAEERLRLAASVFTHSHEGILITDPEVRIVEVNEAFTRITGYRREDAIGQPPSLLKSGRHGPDFYRELWASLAERGYWAGEIWNRRQNGECYPQFLTISSVRDESGQLLNYVALFSDITVQKQYQQRLERIAHFDALTGLPNRVLLADRLRQAMAQARRRGQQVAVAFIDLDGFKLINDSHGHEVGDQFLRGVGQRIHKSLREWDTVSRLGGDEFVAVMIDLPDRDALKRLLHRLHAALGESLQVGDLLLPLSASIGVAFYPQDQDLDAEQLLRQADQAMYQAKHAGKKRIRYFDAKLDQSHRQRIELLARVREGLAASEFQLHYQPKVDLRAGRIVDVEALLRWMHPERGLLVPADFLPQLEGDELSLMLGEWALERALADQRRWRESGVELGVSVNVAAQQLLKGGFVEQLAAKLTAAGAGSPPRLTLEIVETSVIDDVQRATAVIRDCNALGVGVALDDFGTGYSSLAYLKQLPLVELKIDQSFVRDLLVDPEDLAIIDGILSLGRSFGLSVVAEGVETREQAEILLLLDCSRVQGYGLARPMAADDLPGWLADWSPDPAWLQLPPLDRGLLPLLQAEAEVRGWVGDLIAHLHGELENPPALDPAQCRFGRWLRVLALTLPGGDWLQLVDPLHEALHAEGRRLVEVSAAGPRRPGSTNHDELQERARQLCACLREARTTLLPLAPLPPLPGLTRGTHR